MRRGGRPVQEGDGMARPRRVRLLGGWYLVADFQLSSELSLAVSVNWRSRQLSAS